MNCRADRWYDHTNMKQVHVRSCPLFTTDTMTSRNLSLLLSYTSWAVQIPSRQLPRISITEETRKAFSVNSKMEEILDIIFKGYNHSIISLEDFTDTIFHSIEGKKAETLKLSCQYFFIQCPNSCIVVVCVCLHIHPWCYSPFWALASHRWRLHSCLSSAHGMRACVCVYICQQLSDLVVRSVGIIFCLSLYKVCHIIIIPYIQYHMQWSWNKRKVEANA